MEVYWLEQTEVDVPQQNDWLSASEIAVCEGLRFAQRRASWRLGRWTAKRALAICWKFPDFPPALAKIEVRPAPSGAPEVFFENKLAPVTISLSHRNSTGFCVVAPPGADLGCDLELIEPHTDPFVADYFAAEEQALVAQRAEAERPELLALLWSAKESALKALHEGLRLDTRSVIVSLGDRSADGTSWSPISVRHTGGQTFHGWWQIADQMIRTVVAAPQPALPIALNSATYPGGLASAIARSSERPAPLGKGLSAAGASFSGPRLGARYS